jgi:hypothetical protein
MPLERRDMPLLTHIFTLPPRPRQWRNALLVRRLHLAALISQLTRLERETVTGNKRREKNTQMQASGAKCAAWCGVWCGGVGCDGCCVVFARR